MHHVYHVYHVYQVNFKYVKKMVVNQATCDRSSLNIKRKLMPWQLTWYTIYIQILEEVNFEVFKVKWLTGLSISCSHRGSIEKWSPDSQLNSTFQSILYGPNGGLWYILGAFSIYQTWEEDVSPNVDFLILFLIKVGNEWQHHVYVQNVS